MKIFTSKVVVVGDQEVGKTSLLLKYSKNTFQENYKPTLGADFIIKEEKLDNEDEFHLYLWDLAGHPSFSILRQYYMHGANGALVCFALNSNGTFDSVENWLKDVYRVRPQKIPVILVGTKSDIDQEVDQEKIDNFCAENDLVFMTTSSKTGDNIREVFLKMIDLIMEQNKQ
ncbi:MAG TPA: Rab family GTPase [Candidatus Lokiarchaeia archaeon]|nr:Rab family GTPase [Candidatus Lokiarchaeia archaeon]